MLEIKKDFNSSGVVIMEVGDSGYNSTYVPAGKKIPKGFVMGEEAETIFSKYNKINKDALEEISPTSVSPKDAEARLFKKLFLDVISNIDVVRSGQSYPKIQSVVLDVIENDKPKNSEEGISLVLKKIGVN